MSKKTMPANPNLKTLGIKTIGKHLSANGKLILGAEYRIFYKNYTNVNSHQENVYFSGIFLNGNPDLNDLNGYINFIITDLGNYKGYQHPGDEMSIAKYTITQVREKSLPLEELILYQTYQVYMRPPTSKPSYKSIERVTGTFVGGKPNLSETYSIVIKLTEPSVVYHHRPVGDHVVILQPSICFIRQDVPKRTQILDIEKLQLQILREQLTHYAP